MSLSTYMQAIATALETLGYQASSLTGGNSDVYDRYDINFTTGDASNQDAANHVIRKYLITITLSVGAEYLTSDSYGYVEKITNAQIAIDRVDKTGYGVFELCTVRDTEKQTDANVVVAVLETSIDVADNIEVC